MAESYPPNDRNRPDTPNTTGTTTGQDYRTNDRSSSAIGWILGILALLLLVGVIWWWAADDNQVDQGVYEDTAVVQPTEPADDALGMPEPIREEPVAPTTPATPGIE